MAFVYNLVNHDIVGVLFSSQRGGDFHKIIINGSSFSSLVKRET